MATATKPAKSAKRKVVTSVESSVSRRRRVGAASPGQQADDFRRDGPSYQGALLGGFSAERDLSPEDRRRMVRLSRLNHKRSGVYGQVLDTLVDFTVADGAVVACTDPRAQAFWDRVTMDPANAWDRTYRQRVTMRLVDGEYVLTATVPFRGLDANAQPILSGTVLFGRMEPDSITAIETSEINVDRLLSLAFQPAGALKPFTLPMARPNVKLRDNGDGTGTAAFFWRCNTLGVRGVPYLSRSLDKATMLDAVVDELARKAEYTSRFWLHATYDSTGDKREDAKVRRELLAWLRSWTPGEAAATTGNVKVTAIAPELGVVDAKAFVDLVLEYVLGSHGIPRMWYAAGGDTNRATAVEQGTPIHRRLDALQSDLRSEIEDVIRFVLWVGKASGVLPPDVPETFSVTMADVATRDSIRDVNELQGLVMALDSLVASEIISPVERQAIGRRALQGKSYGDLLKPETAPTITPPGLSAPPPGSMPGFGTGDTGMGAAPESGRGPAAVLPPGA